MKIKNLHRIHFLSIVAFALTNPVSAATLTYNGTSGNWDTDANWSGAEPVSGDQARVVSGETVTVDQAGEASGRLEISNSSTVIVTSSGALTLDAVSQSASLSINNGIFNVTGGSVVAGGVVNNFLNNGGQINLSGGTFTHQQNLRFGDGSTTGTLDVSGAGSWTNGQLVIVGTGNLNLSGSSAQITGVSITNSSGTALNVNLTPDSGGLNAIGVSSLNLSSTDTLNFNTDALSGIQALTLFNYSGSLTSTFDTVNITNSALGNLSLGSNPLGDASNLNAGEYFIDYGDGSGDSIQLFYNIPEPSSSVLLGLGGLALVFRRKR